MKYLIILVALILSFSTKAFLSANAQGQTRSINANARFDDSRQVTYINNTTSDQIIFTDTIRQGRFLIDKRYNFTADFTLSVPLLNIPNISFKIKIGDAPAMSFVTNAGLVIGTTQSSLSINGYFQRRLDGTVFLNFKMNPPGTGLLGITLNSTSVNELGTATPTMTGNVPVMITVNFNNTSGTTSLTRLSLARSDF